MQIKSRNIEATFASRGAELKSLKFEGEELLWQSEEGFWPLSAPILFPFCGFLKNGFYLHEDRKYEAPVHGFASQSEFKVEEQGDSKITFALVQNEQTKKIYPFDFKLYVSYELRDSGLEIEFNVNNTSSSETLPFSIGWHPGFNYSENSFLKFSQSTFQKRIVSKEGLIGESEKLILENGKLPLNKDTFAKGGIVIENFSSQVSLDTPNYEIEFNLSEFPNLVLWGQPGANFVCVEPWYGMGDTVEHDNDFLKKEHLLKLLPGEDKTFKTSLKIKA